MDVAVAFSARVVVEHQVPLKSVAKAAAIDSREATGCKAVQFRNVLWLQTTLDDNVSLFITLHFIRVEVLQHVGCRQAVVTCSAVCRLARATRHPTAPNNIVPLVGWLDCDNEIMAVGNHHVCDLVKSLSCYFNAINFQDFIIHSQQACALRQAPGNHTGDEDTGYFLQSVRSHPYAGAIANVKPQGFLTPVPIQPHSSVCFGKNVHINYGRHWSKIMRHTNVDVGTPAEVVIAQCHQSLLLPRQCIGPEIAVVHFI